MSIFPQLKVYAAEVITAAIAAGLDPDHRMSLEEAKTFEEKVSTLIDSLESISSPSFDPNQVLDSVGQLLELTGSTLHRIGRIL